MQLSRFIRKSIFTTAFLSVLLAFLVSIFFQYNNFQNELNHYKEEFTQQKKEEVRSEVLMLHNFIEYKENILKKGVEDRIKDRVNQAYILAMDIYNNNKNTKTKEEIKFLIVQALKDFKFKDHNSYFFINSNKGQAILFDKEIKLDKYTNVWDLEDSSGNLIIQNQIKIAKEQKEGFTTNFFIKPNSTNKTQYIKLSYVKIFEPFDWHIGLGEYLDELREKNKQDMLNWISSLKYKNSNYIFVNSIDSNTLIFEGKKVEPKPHPYPELFKQIAQIAQNQNGDFYEYNFKKPNSSEEFKKISFIKKYENYGWIIGGGVYLDEVESELNRKEALFKQNINKQLTSILIIFIIIFVLVYFISLRIANFINENIENLINAFTKSSLENEKIDTNKLTYNEFVLLANNLNHTLENKNMVEQKLQNYVNIVNQNVIISTTNKEGVITDVSEAFCEISGYTKDELIGKTHNIVRHPTIDISFYQEMWNTLLSGNEWRGEIKNLNKDGKTYWVYAIITPAVKDKKIEGFTAIRTNITNKKYIEKLSITDELTKLYNRRYFNKKIEEEINRAKREQKHICLMILDIDYFKQYNDTYGHQKGDLVLQEVAMVLTKRTSRASDFAFRIGGEEFAIVTSLEHDKVEQFANAIKDDIYNLRIEHANSKVAKYVTTSIGVSCKMANDIKNIDEIFKQADDNLYEAKCLGRNSICIK